MHQIHPILQFASTLFCAYALWLGSRRVLSLHLGRPVPFRRARHVTAGRIGLLGLFVGVFLGMGLMYAKTGSMLVTSPHGTFGAMLLAPILFGLLSGAWMEMRKRPRVVLPLLHGIANAIVLFGALYQASTGKAVAEKFFGG